MIRNASKVLVLAIATLLAAATTQANQRIALVIGNNAYADSPLFNPVNDANAVDARLGELGFEVIKVTDADLGAMQDALLRFSSRIQDGATALVFFAGHGVQAKGRNYLVPVDAELASESTLRFEAVDTADILEELEYSPSKLNIVILDACRNNPFLGRTRGGSRGLAAIDAAAGTLIAYATAPGSVASDGSGGNGLYTENLLGALALPGLQVEEVFKQVRIGVAEYSDGEQIPWESSSLTGDFVFNQAVPAVATATPVLPISGEAATEALYWDSVRGSSDAAPFESYLSRYPHGSFAALAQTRLDALARAPAASAQCADLSGRWLEYRDDRECASEMFFVANPVAGSGADAEQAATTYEVRTSVCPAPGALGALSTGTSTAAAVLSGHRLDSTWNHGPCSGRSQLTMDADCSGGAGVIVGERGLFGTCAGIRIESRIQRAARLPAD